MIRMRVSEQSDCIDQESSVRKTHCQWETEGSSVEMNKEFSQFLKIEDQKDMKWHKSVWRWKQGKGFSFHTTQN